MNNFCVPELLDIEISHTEGNHGYTVIYMQISAALPSPNFQSGKRVMLKNNC